MQLCLPLSLFAHLGLFCPAAEQSNQLFADLLSIIPLSTLQSLTTNEEISLCGDRDENYFCFS